MGYYEGRQGDFIWSFVLARRFGAIYSGTRWLEEVYTLATTNSTQCMIALAMVVQTVHDSELVGCVLVSLLGHAGQLFIARATARELGDKKLVNAATLAPSLIFWTSGFVKEAIAVCGIGLIVDAISMFVHTRRIPVLRLMLGGLLVVGIKPFLMFPVVVMAFVWIAWQESNSKRRSALGRPIIFASVAGIGLLVVVQISRLFPHFSPENFTTEVDRLQRLAAGGSTTEGTQGSIWLRAPVGLFAALFRPQLFEVRNPLMLLSAVEVTVATGLALLVIFRTGLRETWVRTLSKPYVLGSLFFALLCGAAVGTTTLNLGTLSRYRVPLVPFFATWLMACSARKSPNPRRESLPSRKGRGSLSATLP